MMPTVELAQGFCVACACAGLVTCALAARSLLKLRRPVADWPGDVLPMPGAAGASGVDDPTLVAASEEIPGAPGEVSLRLASALASGAAGMPLRIIERTDSLVRFEPGVLGAAASIGGEFTLKSSGSGNSTRVDCRIDLEPLARKLGRIGLSIVIFVSIPAATVLPAMLFLYVATSADPAVRWQSLQSLQMIHGLWPPFLFGMIFRRVRTAAAGTVKTVLSNVKHGA
jgi:hypothetical protein